MRLSLPTFKPRQTRSEPNKKNHEPQEEPFQISHIFKSLSQFPQAMSLVWQASKRLTLGMLFLSTVRGFLPACSALIAKMVVDSVVHGIQTHSISPLWLPIILQLIVSLFDRLLSRSSLVVQQLLQDRTSNHIQLLIFEKANTLDLAFFEQPEFYDKLRTASSESSYKPVLMVALVFETLRTTITLISMLFLLIQLAWWLTIIALVVPIPSFLASAKYGWYDYRRMVRQSPEKRKMNYYNQILTVDHFNKELKLFSLGDFFVERYRHLAELLYQEGQKEAVRRNGINLLWTGFSIIVNTGIYCYVALQAILGHITLGGLTLYTQAATQVGSSFQGILDNMADMYEYTLYIGTVFEFLAYKPAIFSPELPHPFTEEEHLHGLEIEFRHVSFTYPGKDPETQAALKDVSFHIQAGETAALVGYNGAGKTTLVKLLTRLYDPDEGEILLGGRNLKDYDLVELRERIGIMLQDYVNYHLSARENIGIGRLISMEDKERIAMAARRSGASSVIEKLPSGYETTLGKWFKEGVQLSGGEWQKVALARVFIREAGLLILDEPTSALDAQAEYDLFKRFRELTQGKTALFISHRFSTVRQADRIFVLEHGRLQESGTHEELMQLAGRYAHLFSLQAAAYQ